MSPPASRHCPPCALQVPLPGWEPHLQSGEPAAPATPARPGLVPQPDPDAGSRWEAGTAPDVAWVCPRGAWETPADPWSRLCWGLWLWGPIQSPSRPTLGLACVSQRDTRGARWPGLSCPFCRRTPDVCFHLGSRQLGGFSLEQSCSHPDSPSRTLQPAPPVGEFWQQREGQRDNPSLCSDGSVAPGPLHGDGAEKGHGEGLGGGNPSDSHPPCLSFPSREVRDHFPRWGCHLGNG